MAREKKGDRVNGPYKRGAGWRVVVVRGGCRIDRTYPTEEEARAVAREAGRQLGALSTSVGEAVDGYLDDAARRQVKARSVETYRKRLELLLDPIWGLPVSVLSPVRAAALYQRLVGVVAVDTHRGALIVARTWSSWCVDAGYLRLSPFARVKGVGRRRRGKPQLHLTEARTLLDACLARPGDRGAIVTAALLLLGCRVGDLVDRRVRDLDDEGRLLWIPEAKTEAGRRVLEVPAILRPHLVALAAGRSPFDPLVGMTREGAWAAVRRLCRIAGVPVVSPHGLRGTHSSLARAAGATAEVVAGQLGHAGTAVQDAHYVAPGIAQLVTQQRALRVLDGGR